MPPNLTIRNALPTDLDAVVAIDQVGTVKDKPAYWRGIFDRYVNTKKEGGFFLVAEKEDELIGFIVGEVRAWEFGSPPCGWVFALSVAPDHREAGVGELMFREMCQRLKNACVSMGRTLVDRRNKLTLSFFRSQGLRTGPYIELERPLDDI